MSGVILEVARSSWKERGIRRNLILLALTAGILSYPSTAPADAGCHSRSCVERVYRKQCSNSNVVACIHRATMHHHQPFRDAMRVARCESSLDPHNSYVGHIGLFQFLQSTFNTTIYARHDPWSAKWNSLAAMWMWRVGRRNEWACRLGWCRLACDNLLMTGRCECGCGETVANRFVHGHNARLQSLRATPYKVRGRWFVIDRERVPYAWARLVMWNELGREPAANQIVHHINRDSSDDRPENLQILSPSQHAAEHFAAGEWHRLTDDDRRKGQRLVERVVVPCEMCGKQVERLPNQMRGKQFFCSNECRWQAVREGKLVLKPKQTHCKRGHPFTGDVRLHPKTGVQICRACKNEAARAARARKRLDCRA